MSESLKDLSLFSTVVEFGGFAAAGPEEGTFTTPCRFQKQQKRTESPEGPAMVPQDVAIAR